MLSAKEIVDIYIAFFEHRGHKRIPNSPLIPENDPTTLFTSSGMQPLVPYLLGEQHPQGKRLVNVQNCFRAQDIEEVGDNRHITFFRMLGNWSLGDYFKKEQIPWMWEFVTKELGIPKEKLYATVFKGENGLPKDEETEQLWTDIFQKEGLDPKQRIFHYGAEKNWWSRSGIPDKMPIGEPGGPDTEIFFDFGTPHDKKFGEKCHVNCDCGRFFEICNGVFMQYKKTEKGFESLPKKNVDFGGGLERLLAAVENKQDIFQTSLYSEAVKSLQALTKTNTNYDINPKPYRIIIDHLKASVFMVADNVFPSNKGQGYVLRRLIRRSMVYARQLGMTGDEWLSNALPSLIQPEIKTYPHIYNKLPEVNEIITQEVDKFRKTIEQGLKEMKKMFQRVFGGIDPENLPPGMKISNNKYRIDGKEVFKIYETYGLPIEIAQEIMTGWGVAFDDKTMKEAKKAMEAHQNISRVGATKKFAGGLADHSEKTIMGHTATHLMHQALRDVLGNHVFQSGSNITSERVRFDFNFERNLTPDEIRKVEQIVNEKIQKNLPVHFEMMTLEKAKQIGAIGLFDDKYQDTVKIYFIGGSPSTNSARSGLPRSEYYSVEFCGGPHVDFTSQVKRFKIIKQENIGHGQRRIYASIG